MGETAARMDALLARTLARGGAAWPPSATPELDQGLLERARGHRVGGLLAGVGRARLGELGWPESLLDSLESEARELALAELLRDRALGEVLEAFAQAGIATLVFKGAAFAPRIHRQAHLRPGLDRDLWVSEGQRERAETLLLDLGYRRGPRIRGRLIEYQAPYGRGRPEQRSVIDLHWKVSNRQALAAAFDFDEHLAASEPLRVGGASTRAVDLVDALQIACVHGPGHHHGESWPLLWDFDIHLIARALGSSRWGAVVERSRERGVARLVGCGLARVRRLFGAGEPGAGVPDPVLSTLLATSGEASARLLAPRFGMLAEDVRALHGLGRKLRLLREAVLPDPDYLRARYGAHPRVVRPGLYAHRLLAGVRKRVGAESR